MNNKLRYELSSHLEDSKRQYEAQSIKLNQLEGLTEKRLKASFRSNKSIYYSVYDPESNKYRYLGTDSNEEVSQIKEAHLLKMSVSNLLKEISRTETYIKRSVEVDFEAINSRLSKTYRLSSYAGLMSLSDAASTWKKEMKEYKKTFAPFRPDELIHRTRDGQYVRSKGEALIYNYLLDLNVSFIYELPLVVKSGYKNGLLLPDFTILSELDYKSVIYIEHQGKMDSTNYRNKFIESVYKYWSNDYIPERDVFFTFDLPNGGFDDSPIKSIVERCVRPTINSSYS